MPMKKVDIQMPLSAKRVFNLLQQEGTLRMIDISNNLPNYTERTLRNAIKLLIQMELIEAQPDLMDMRRRFYIYIGESGSHKARKWPEEYEQRMVTTVA